MLGFEKAKGQEHALEMPDELTVAHMWKGARREYAFDTVFTADTTQAQVRAADEERNEFHSALLGAKASGPSCV